MTSTDELVMLLEEFAEFYLERPAVDAERQTPGLYEISKFECRRVANAAKKAARAIEALEAEKAKKDEALDWYAIQVAACRKITHEGDTARSTLDRDGGSRARAALSGAQVERLSSDKAVADRRVAEEREACAKWHDAQAAHHRVMHRAHGFSWDAQRAVLHESSASAIRSRSNEEK